MLSPEDQYKLYIAIRDGTLEIIEKFVVDMDDINSPPFDSLWHDPGNESTLLHLASCCIQLKVVEFLLKQGANPLICAQGLTSIDVLEKYELFMPTRIQKANEVIQIRKILEDYKLKF